MLKVKIFTLYPDLFPGPLDVGIYKRAREKKIWSLDIIDIRNYDYWDSTSYSKWVYIILTSDGVVEIRSRLVEKILEER